MAEAVRPRKSKHKIAALIRQLEEISVPAQSDEEETAEAPPVELASQQSESHPAVLTNERVDEHELLRDGAVELSTATEACSNEDSSERHQDADVDSTTRSLATESLYPQLDSLERCSTAPAPVDPTAPCIPLIPQECCLPPALESDRLRDFYANKVLDNIATMEMEFLQEISAGLAVSRSEKHPFEVLLDQYVHYWNSWNYALERSKSVYSELEALSTRVWKVSHQTGSVSGKCDDGATVTLAYDYDEAELDADATQEVEETERILRWVIFEELPMLAFELARARNAIHSYILKALSRCMEANALPRTSDSVQWLHQSGGVWAAEMQNIRSVCSILFSAIRHHASVESTIDMNLQKPLRDWLLLVAKPLLQSPRLDEHVFLLMHLMRLPSRCMGPLLGLLNPPDPTSAWRLTASMNRFLHHPLVDVSLSLFAICLRPVRERNRFVTIHPSVHSVSDEPSTECPWTVVDSAGESDLEDSNGAYERSAMPTSQPPSPTATTKRDEECAVYLAPRDLSRLLRQLNLERLLQSLTSASHCTPASSDLITLMAFADRFMDLIERCADIYADHVDSPKRQSHLGGWRALTKRLAHLICLLVSAVGSQVRAVWTAHPSSHPELYRIMAQYDAFCLRIARCLLSGCGMPSTHHNAVRLVCWRSLASLFPFGLMSTESKISLLHLILSSLLPTWKEVPSSSLSSVPGQVIEPLHRSLLLMGLNDLGLEAIVQVLGQLAAAECRPMCCLSPESTQTWVLPTFEADLVCCITQIVFGLTVFHAPDPSSDSPKRSLSVGYMPIVPGCGRSQLVNIASVHVSITLPLLFTLIVECGEHVQEDAASQSSTKSLFFSPKQPCQRPGVKELLLALVAEVPFNLFRPDAPILARLIDWLCDHSQSSFNHLLARCLLSRFSWESIVSGATEETFLPFQSHLDLALALAQLADNLLTGSSRLQALTHHPTVLHILATTSSSASFTMGLLLRRLGYEHVQIRNLRDLMTPHNILNRTRPMISYQLDTGSRRSRSQDRDTSTGTVSTQGTLSWCVDLLLRLHLPGCAATAREHSQQPTSESKTWSTLLSLNCERNALAAFLIMSVHMNMHGPSLRLPSGLELSGLIETIVESQQTKLILRTMFLLFNQLTSSQGIVEYPGFERHLTRVLLLYHQGQLYPQCGPEFLPLLIGSCLDACLGQPYTSHNLLRILITVLCSSRCLAVPNSAHLLDAVLRIAVWIPHGYIPLRLGAVSNLDNWTNDGVVTTFRHAILAVYKERLSKPPSHWSTQLVALGSSAWRQSSRAIQDLKGRFSGESPHTTKSDSEDHLAAIQPSILGMFMPHLKDRGSRTSPGPSEDLPPLFPFILMYLFDSDLQSCVQHTDEYVEYNWTSMWSQLVPVLSRHTHELLSASASRSVETQDDGCLPRALVLVLEQILLEANLLSETFSSNLNSKAEIRWASNRIRGILQQLCLVQGISLLDACPLEDPALLILIHAVLRQLLGLDLVSVVVDGSSSSSLAGIILLRSLSWSAFRLTPDTGESLVQGQTLYDVLVSKIETFVAHLSSLDELTIDLSKLLNALKNALKLLSRLEALVNKKTLFTPGRSTEDSALRFQGETVDALLDAFDWRQQTKQLQYYIELWNNHRRSSVSPILPGQDQPTKPMTVSVFSKSTPPDQRRHGPPEYALQDLLAGSISATLPKKVDEYLGKLQVLHSKLSQRIAFISERMTLIDQLQVNHRTSLLPKLYQITTTKKSERVECRSIIPTWISGSKGCHGGARLSCEYQTAKLDPKISQNVSENRLMVKELVDDVVGESSLAALASLKEDLLPDKKRKVDWARLGLELEFVVRQLVDLAHTTRSPYTTHAKDAQVLHSVGLTCFEDLCANLSGPLLFCPVSKKLLASCIQLLAEEFLPSLTAGYERVLDLLVALPHLSAILLPTFCPPGRAALSDQPHPLTTVYARLMDVKFRCGPEVALNILKTIDISMWYVRDDGTPSFPLRYLTELFVAISKCVEQTRDAGDRDVDKMASLHMLLVEHLAALLSSNLPELFVTVCDCLFQDVNNITSLPVWLCLRDVLDQDIADRGSFFMSIDQLSALLDKIAVSLVKPASSPANRAQPVGAIRDLLRCDSSDLFRCVAHILHVLLRELGVKLGNCVQEKHTTVALAAPSFWKHWESTIGSVIPQAAEMEFQSSCASGDHRSLTNLSALLELTSALLQRTIEACPVNISPAWCSTLFDSVVHWLITTPCVNAAGRPSASSSTCLSALMPVAAVFASLQTSQSRLIEPLYDCFNSCGYWQPTIATMDSFIKLLFDSQSYSRPFSAESIAQLLVPLFNHVTFNSKDLQSPFNSSPMVGDHQSWTHDRSADINIAYAETVTLLCILLSRALLNTDSESKNIMQSVLESVLADMHLSQVNERFYSFAASHLTGSELPLHFVLMPPASMEGRLLGLMASAAAMIAEPTPCFQTTPPPLGSQSGLYPSLHSVSFDLTPLVSTATHQKRLAYVRMITSLLQWTLRRGASQIESSLLVDIVGTCLPHCEPRSTENVSDRPNLFSYLTGSITGILNKMVPSREIKTQDSVISDPKFVFNVLSWFRFGNLLSELEAVAAPFAWSHPTISGFKYVCEFCRELLSLIVSLECRKAAEPSCNPFISDAMLHWLLGKPECPIWDDSVQLHSLCSDVMPRSINAGLSRPIFHSLLALPDVDEQGLVRLIPVLESSAWSVLNFGSSNLTAAERLESLCSLVNSDGLNGSTSTTNRLIHACLRTSALLPLVIFLLKRSGAECSTAVIMADSMHYLSVVNLKPLSQGHTIRLHSFLLFLGFLLKNIWSDRDSTAELSCCSSHPAWKPNVDSNTTDSCDRASQVTNMLKILTGIRSSVAKLCPVQKPEDPSIRFLSFIDCFGSVLECWLGNPKPHCSHFNLLSGQLDPNPAAPKDPIISIARPILSMLNARLPSMKLNEAILFLMNQFWPHQRGCVQELLSSWLTNC